MTKEQAFEILRLHQAGIKQDSAKLLQAIKLVSAIKSPGSN
jgi:very-short-patch-repair endonuclease